jgi:hypothetical protein
MVERVNLMQVITEQPSRDDQCSWMFMHRTADQSVLEV